MYVDGAKTMITASGIAVALLASSAVSSVRTTNNTVAVSAKVAVVCLIACVCSSLVLILMLLRGYEVANAEYMERERAAGRLKQAQIQQGGLSKRQLLCILAPAGVALSCFLVGFVYLARIAVHF